MRFRKVTLSIVFLVILLASAPSLSSAVTVKITSGTATPITLSVIDPGDHTVTQCVNGTVSGSQCVNGTWTTTVDLSNIGVINGFTITCTLCKDLTGAALKPQVIAEQSGSTEKVTITNATITAPPATTTVCPCSIVIDVSSDPTDFPMQKTANQSYLSGVFMSGGTFVGTLTGDSISARGLANGDTINPILVSGPTDTPESLPKFCSGSVDCRWKADIDGASIVGTENYISETIVLPCPTAQPTCTVATPSVATRITVNLNNNDFIDPEVGTVQTRTNSPKKLAVNFAPFSQFSGILSIALPTNFDLKATFTVNAASSTAAPNTIDPVRNGVSLRIGPSTIFLPPGAFQPTTSGWGFQGALPDGRQVQAAIFRLGGNAYGFSGQSGQVDLTGTGNPGSVVGVRVDLGIGHDGGTALFTAEIQ